MRFTTAAAQLIQQTNPSSADDIRHSTAFIGEIGAATTMANSNPNPDPVDCNIGADASSFPNVSATLLRQCNNNPVVAARAMNSSNFHVARNLRVARETSRRAFRKKPRVTKTMKIVKALTIDKGTTVINGRVRRVLQCQGCNQVMTPALNAGWTNPRNHTQVCFGKDTELDVS